MRWQFVKLVTPRPLTVLTSMSAVYTKLMNGRLSRVVESHRLLGEIQNSFRKTRSGADCNFILNTILWKSVAKQAKVHLAFLDLKKGEFDANMRMDVSVMLHAVMDVDCPWTCKAK